MPQRYVECPLCGNRLPLGSSAPAAETFTTCSACLHTIIVGPVGDGHQARLPGGPYPAAATTDGFDMRASGNRPAPGAAMPYAGSPLHEEHSYLASGNEHLSRNWTLFRDVRLLARRVLKVARAPVLAVKAGLDVWRHAMATHPITTMIWSFLTAGGIIAMLLVMWLIVLELIRKRY